jgi:putative sterol carrier protein
LTVDNERRGRRQSPAVGRARQKPGDSTAAFFDDLATREREPLLDNAKGTTRFDIVHRGKTARWFVTIDNGAVSVSQRNASADCVVRADKALFDQLAEGKKNAVAAVLRGDLAIEGDWRLLVRMQRLFPGKRRSRARRTR